MTTTESEAGGEAGPDATRATLRAAERWFSRQGVPHFSSGPVVVVRLPRRLEPARSVVEQVLILWSVAGWILRRLRAERREIGLLAGRGIPMLALFGVLLFFSGDFWHVAVSLTAGWQWLVSWFFFILTFAFLLAQLPSEYVELSGEYGAEEIRIACAASNLPALVDDLADDDLIRIPSIGRNQNRNMLVFLLLRFQIQLALFSWMLFGFFIVFGSISIRPAVIEGWFGRRPSYPAHVFGVPIPGVSSELMHASLLLAALSTFYFTVSALTDDSFRRNFLAGTIAELRGAVAVRCGYLSRSARLDQALAAAAVATEAPLASVAPVSAVAPAPEGAETEWPEEPTRPFR